MGRVFCFAQLIFRVGGLPWLGISILEMLILSPALLGQTSPDSEGGVAVPADWSHRHLVFLKPPIGKPRADCDRPDTAGVRH